MSRPPSSDPAGTRVVETPIGPARVTVARSVGPARTTLVLGHGAGGGIGAPDLVALARALPARGITVVRVEQPWVLAGRKVAAPPATLDKAWLAVVGQLTVEGPLVVGGRSAGARVACRTAVPLGASGCVALAFPLRPPGSDKSRLAELEGAGVPTLVVQGERDAFGSPADFPRRSRGHVLHVVPHADHSFRVAKAIEGGGAAALRDLTSAVGDWLAALG